MGSCWDLQLVLLVSLVAATAGFAANPPQNAVGAGRQRARSTDCAMLAQQPRVAVVTGANKGIGLEVARILGSVPGVLCVIGCRNTQLGRQAADALKREGKNVTFAQLDITDEKSIQDFANSIKTTYGGLDILVNNAAIAFKGSDPTPFPKQARPTIRTNFYGTLAVCDALFPLLRSGGRVSNVASMSGPLRQFPQHTHSRVLAPDFSREELCALVESFVT
jgi:carbonyl reductase 1